MTLDFGLWTACYIARVGFKSETHDRFIFLKIFIKELREPRRLPDKKDNHAGRKRVERAGVSDAFCLQNLSGARNDIVRRYSGWFVDD